MRDLALAGVLALSVSLLPLGAAASAQTPEPPAPQPGSLSGTVTDTTGAPVEGTTITARDRAGAEWTTGSGSSGTFVLTELPPADYQLRFDPPSGSGLTLQWYAGATSDVDAQWIPVAEAEVRCCFDAVLSPPPIAAGTPSIVGEAAVGSTLTVDPGLWPEGTSFTYQWLVSDIEIAGASSAEYPLTTADRDKTISVRVTGTLQGYADASRTSGPTARVIVAGSPTITGTAATGSTLTATTGTWTKGTAFAYQWRAGGAEIPGATSATFVPGAAQDGVAITVDVSGSKVGYATVTRSAKPTSLVMRSSVPKISGALAVNRTVRAEPGTWTAGAVFTFQWYLDGKAISGATAQSLKISSAMRDKKLSVKVTAKKPGHPTVSKTSAASGKITTASTPTISGTAAVGSTLTAKAGAWLSGTSLSYQWYADGVAIAKATAATYRLASAHEGARISVKVTGKKSGYATTSLTSASTVRVLRAGTPSISGTAQVTRTVKVVTGTWTSGSSLRIQWFADGVAIKGATSSTLKIGSGLAGKRLTVKVTGSRSGYATVTKTSAASAVIGYPSRTTPTSEWNCPSWAPIKGNKSSMIYHMPGQRFYDRTKPEDCFRTESAAVSAGYRKAKV
ncbi:carboxypeptidase regulatory-like domain-containing protein [Microbacterium chocolatum]|uniref:sunset domain-containing protein n=1 Tax=Microbacterium aurantiacum TaxID=162393 RepID=UPI00338DBA51